MNACMVLYTNLSVSSYTVCKITRYTTGLCALEMGTSGADTDSFYVEVCREGVGGKGGGTVRSDTDMSHYALDISA